jgi:hypothetical protein
MSSKILRKIVVMIANNKNVMEREYAIEKLFWNEK